MKLFISIAAGCIISLAAWGGDKPIEVKSGEALPASLITTNHLGPFKHDMPAVLPMVVVSFQTQATEKAGSMLLGGGIKYTLEGIPPALMQKIANEAQDAIESELKAGGWSVLPPEKVAGLEVYKSWIKDTDVSGEEVKRQFFSAGRGTNTFSSKELERIFVGGKRPLVGNGVVLGGWTGGIALCKIGQAVGAKVILVRAIVNFANISAGKRGFFGDQTWRSNSTLEVSYAEMDVYPPDPSGATPARLATDAPITLRSNFIKDVQKSGGSTTIIADPDLYEKDTVEVIRCIAKGFVAKSNK